MATQSTFIHQTVLPSQTAISIVVDSAGCIETSKRDLVTSFTICLLPLVSFPRFSEREKLKWNYKYY